MFFFLKSYKKTSLSDKIQVFLMNFFKTATFSSRQKPKNLINHSLVKLTINIQIFIIEFFSALWVDFSFTLLVPQQPQNMQNTLTIIFAGIPRFVIPAYQRE